MMRKKKRKKSNTVDSSESFFNNLCTTKQTNEYTIFDPIRGQSRRRYSKHRICTRTLRKSRRFRNLETRIGRAKKTGCRSCSPSPIADHESCHRLSTTVYRKNFQEARSTSRSMIQFSSFVTYISALIILELSLKIFSIECQCFCL